MRKPPPILLIATPIMALCKGEDYLDKFDPYVFLRQHCGSVSGSQHILRCCHDAFQSLPSNITVLDYGSGPSIRVAISAAAKASEIVLSDYSPSNRQALRDWLDNKPDYEFDWDPYFSHVVRELEGKGEGEVAKRQEDVRKLVKAVAHCDLTQDPPIEERYNKLYDVVASSFVVEGIATNYEEYCSLIARMAKLVKPGGCFILYGVENNEKYTVGNYTFKDFPVTSSMAIDAIKGCGIADIKLDKTTLYMFIQGTLPL